MPFIEKMLPSSDITELNLSLLLQPESYNLPPFFYVIWIRIFGLNINICYVRQVRSLSCQKEKENINKC